MQFKNINAFYGQTQVLSGISFDLKPQKFTALIGKNGCGKSTLLGCAAGQVRYNGEILLAGQPIQNYPPRERAKKLAVLPQFLPATPMSTIDLVAMGRTPYTDLTGRLQPADHQKIEAAISFAGIEELRHRPVSALSGGERQRVYLAMILAQDAEILLLDEPTAHMDMGFASDFLQLLRSLAENHGKTILAVLHDLNAATAFAQELLLIDNGKLTDPARIEEVFGVRKAAYMENGETKYFYH